MSEQKLSHDVKGLACRAERQDCVETDLDTEKKFCCVEGSQEHLASIILNEWSLKQLGLFLDLASWPTEQSKEKGFGKRGDQDTDGDSGRAPWS